MAVFLRASVIVPAYNAASDLGACLEALLSQTVPSSRYEIIVVDDGSADDTAGVARCFPVTVLVQPNRGAAAARNLGAQHACGDVLLFTDADCVPRSDWIAHVLARFEDSVIDGAKGVYATQQHELVARFVQIEYEERYGRMARRRLIDFIDTYSAAYRRSVFLESGGFDERFPGATVEDQELSFRLAARGCRLMFVHDAVVLHRHANCWGGYFRRKWRIGYWKVLVHRLHPGKLVGDDHTTVSLRLQVVLAAVVPAAAAIGLVVPAAGWAAAAGAALFVASALPLVVKALRRDSQVALIVVPMVVLRAIALASGLAAGILAAAARDVFAGIARLAARLTRPARSRTQ